MQNSSKEALAINNSILRRHFRELTLALLQPFQPYLTLAPGSVAFPPFDLRDFVRKLKGQQAIFPLLRYTSRRKTVALYENFLACPQFSQWFAERRQRISALRSPNREV